MYKRLCYSAGLTLAGASTLALLCTICPASAEPQVSNASSVVNNTPIKGIHPIKRMMRPIENLEAMTIQLDNQIVKLEGPIVGLQAPMVSLESKMAGVNLSMRQMQGRLADVSTHMRGVRGDLDKMRAEIADLKAPILAIQKPLLKLANPLETIKRQLNLVILAIAVASIGIVIGTPMAALVVYRFRGRLFSRMVPAATVAATDSKSPQNQEAIPEIPDVTTLQ